SGIADQYQTGQDLTTVAGKILRIDVDHEDTGLKYSVPKDNPFVGMKDVRPETWAYGFRNPWRVTCDRKTGDIWVGNNGQDLWEQAYRVERGANYGWSVMEGSHPFYLDRKAGPTPFVKPTVEHSHSEARSLTGGVVYYGAKLPELRGAYVYGDHSTGKVWAVKHDGKKITFHRELVDTPFHITHFCLDSHSELLVLDHQGEDKGNLYYLEPNAPSEISDLKYLKSEISNLKSPISFPRRLSDSGLFASVQGHVMQPGLIPYSVNAALWSDGSHKARWIAIPHAERTEPPIEMTATRGWNMPDDTVLVKSFALEADARDESSRRWIETRFLLKQQGQWFGYSYEWNDEQTEGVLVESSGKDREFAIRDPQANGGVRKQTWHYPSRSECMICHSRAANFVLGLSTLQFNRDHDYGGVTANQLRVLEHLGLLKVTPWQTEHVNAIREEARAKGLPEKEVDDAVKSATATRDQRSAPKTTLLAMSPDKLPRLADPYDRQADLTARARSYLHANCAICHVEAGGGNAQMQLEYFTPLAKAKLIDEKPLHHKFDLTDPRIIAAGHPERSTLLTRISRRGPSSGQMPQLATSIVDHEAVELFREWIVGLKAP
ncbi:MAG TPA: PQQ-dependent sugar dehydrogenase, partial [Planctomycetaceae bacterium]|nr:PQQ-dependent sugar dehydrogenase [Planctomycetaceae bacterium]